MSIADLNQLEEAYERVFSAALLIQHPAPGLLRLSGGDRLDLLNRISTNDVLSLPSGTMRRTILTNALARIVDVITLFSQAESLLLMTSPKRAADVEAWLNGYIFFQDNVQISRTNPELHHWSIYGPETSTLLKELEFMQPNLGLGRFHDLGDAIVWPVNKPKPGGYELLVSDKLHETIHRTADVLNEGVAERSLFELLRIESGLPQSGVEIAQETIPLEVGLWDEVSFDKGCYIGQEILARMESRGQLARRLVLVGYDGQPAPGMHLWSGKREVGMITSVVFSPRQGWIGLALVKVDALSSLELTAGDTAIPVRILDPLQSARASKRM